MKAGKASRTAQYMALFRALETNRHQGDRLFTDRYAINFLDTGLKLVTKASKIPVFRKFIGGKIQKKIRARFHQDLQEQSTLTISYKEQFLMELNK